MTPHTFTGAMLVLVASVVLALGAFCLILWGKAAAKYTPGLAATALTIGTLILLTVIVWWLSSPLFRSGCC